MRIFMSYASEQKADAEAVAFSLRSRGHMVFFDRDDLPEGTSYDDRIAAAVDRSDLMIFLISPAAVAEGRYTLTELRFARYKWRHPGGRVLPVMMEATPLPAVPAYLRAVSILEPQGNKAAEVAFAVERLRGFERGINIAVVVALVAACTAFVAGLMPAGVVSDSWIPIRIVFKVSDFRFGPALENGVILAVLICAIYARLSDRTWWRLALLAGFCIAAWIAGVWVYGVLEGVDLLKSEDLNVGKIIEAIPEGSRESIKDEIAKLQGFSESTRNWALVLSTFLAFASAGAACMLTLLTGLLLINPAFKNVNRWVLGLLASSVAGGMGYLLSRAILTRQGTLMDIGSFAFVDSLDLFFALIYLPWLVTAASLMSYWLVRGQET
jgi:hypothetical protein